MDDLFHTLSANSKLSGIRFVKAFPENKIPNPLKQVTVAAGLSSVEVKSALDGYYGVKLGAAIVGGRAEAKLRLRIFSPKAAGTTGCNDTFSKLCGALLENTELCVRAVSCSESRYDNACGVFTADAEIALTCFMGKTNAEQEGAV
jgi:hypothetical protein